MKKILVAIAAAAMTLAGMTAPAHATVVTAPSLPGTASVGDTFSATLGSYTNETVTGSSWIFCNTQKTQAEIADGTIRSGFLSAGTCDYLTLVQNGSPATGTSITLPRVIYGNWFSDARLAAGKFIYFAEITGSGPWTWHVSNALSVNVPPTTMPALVSSDGGNDVSPGSTLTVQAGVGIQEISAITDQGVWACNYDAQPVQQSNAWDMYRDPATNAQYCFYLGGNVTHQGPPVFPFTVGNVLWEWNSNGFNVPSTGMYLYYFETYREGYTQTYRSYFSHSMYVGSLAQTVTYDANAGTGAITASVANGARNVSNGAGFAMSGYSFTGWNTAANGSGTAVAAGASYTPSGNVTLYAQWTRIPTPPAPVFTSPIAAAPVGGVLNLTGANMASVTSITVDDQPATIATSSSGQVTVKLPTLAPGKYDITIKNADGGIRFIDGLVVPDPNAKVAPKPTNTYVASSAVKVTGAAPSAKQAAVLTEFVSQYKNAKQATVYIRTSKAGLAAAKKAAAAMLATVVKTLKNVKTGIVVDSTSEKTTSLDLVVND